MNVAKIISKAIKIMPQLEGVSSRVTIGGKQIEQIVQKTTDATTQQLLQAGLQKYKNPVLDVAYKVKSNYAIAGIKVRDGKNVVEKCALSITNPGQRNSVVKLRITDNEGQHIKGFFDSGELIDTRNIGASLYRKNGVFATQAEIGKAYAHDIRLNENELLNLIEKTPNGENLIKQYNDFNTKLRLRTLDIANDARKVLRGEYQAPLLKFEKAAPSEFAQQVEFANLKEFDSSKFKDVINKACKDFNSIKEINTAKILEKYPELKMAATKTPKPIKFDV